MLPNFTIIDTDDVTSIIKKIEKDIALDPQEYSPAFFRNKISFIKNNMLTEGEMQRFLVSEPEKLAIKIYHEYEKILARNNTIDFDDLLKKPVELFKEHPEI